MCVTGRCLKISESPYKKYYIDIHIFYGLESFASISLKFTIFSVLVFFTLHSQICVSASPEFLNHAIQRGHNTMTHVL
jgi:hypothetical protein